MPLQDHRSYASALGPALDWLVRSESFGSYTAGGTDKAKWVPLAMPVSCGVRRHSRVALAKPVAPRGIIADGG